MRKLASIRRIKYITELPNAITIEVARIDGWDVIVKKGLFHAGDLCMFLEADSVLPRTEWSEELFKNSDGKELYIRPKMILGILSQGLAIPLEKFSYLFHQLGINTPIEQINFTEILGITKKEIQYDSKYIIGKKPANLISTSIERIQNIDESFLAACTKANTKIFEKIDGETIIIFIENNQLHCCSNSVELDTESDHPFAIWLRNNASDLLLYFSLDKKIKPEDGAALYGEFFQNDVYFFMESDAAGNVTLISENLKSSVFRTVPEIFIKKIPCDRDGWLCLADGRSKISDRQREGIVVWKDNKILFKAISNKYLQKLN